MKKKIVILFFITCLIFVFNDTSFSQSLEKLPDLVVEIIVPSKAEAGKNIGKEIKMTVKNVGNVAAAGTKGDLDPRNGYMIDYVLSTDESIPKRPAGYSPTFFEDVLLGGGRRSHTLDILASESKEYINGAEIPKDTPTGTYFICAQVDPGNRVKEENEDNNVTCVSIKIENPITKSEK